MKRIRDPRFLLILILFALAACASGPKRGPAGAETATSAAEISAPAAGADEGAPVEAVTKDVAQGNQEAAEKSAVAESSKEKEPASGEKSKNVSSSTEIETAEKADKTANAEEAVAEEPASEFDEDMLASLESEFNDDLDEEASQASISDPLYYYNHIWFHFNDKVYFWVLKPVSKGYDAVTSKGVQKSVLKFFKNIGWPRRFVNLALQGRFLDASAETLRFGVNTTFGLLGLFDPARKIGLKEIEADFDQTLAKRGFNTGIYLIWPLFGPSSVRGTFGVVADAALDPATYLPGVSVLDEVNRIAVGVDPYEDILDASVKPYAGVRNAYVQHRQNMAQK